MEIKTERTGARRVRDASYWVAQARHWERQALSDLEDGCPPALVVYDDPRRANEAWTMAAIEVLRWIAA